MEGSGSLPDGAFERFVTSALAAIITIVFSWRLLAEGHERLEGEGRPRIPIRAIRDKRDEDDDEQNLADIPIDDHVIPSVNSVNLSTPPKYAKLDRDLASSTKTEDGDEPSWGEYSWEEDMYDTVHTRRSLKDFITKPRNSESTSSDEMDMSESDIQLSPIPASHEMLEKLYMNQEYRSIVDDEQNDSTGSSSSDDEEEDIIEGVYDTQTFEPDMYYATGLEPIIEEDSDDFSENEEEYISDNKNDTFVVNSDNEPEGTRQDLVKHQSCENLKLMCSDNVVCQDKVDDSNEMTLENYIDECFDKCLDDKDSSSESDKSDSLPPSPIIRTRAIDEEYANLSDESCSSGSVITVVSVKSDFSDTPEIQIVEESNKPVSFIFPDNETNISDNLKAQDIMSFIHGSNEQLANNFDLNKTPENELLEKEIESERTPTLEYDDFVKDIKAVSETQIEDESKETPEPKVEITGFPPVSEIILENSATLLNKQREPSDDKFDDDVGPREYNPYEDDFAEFEYYGDSDDDSFFFVCGESNNFHNFKTFNKNDSGLRNFDTFDNLDAIGLASPGSEGSCESGILEDGRFIFSRTEEIGTEYRTRVYVKDREDTPASAEIAIDQKTVSPLDSEVENKNSYNERLLCIPDKSEFAPIITELENIELFIDESKIVAKENSPESTKPSELVNKDDCVTKHSVSDINNSQTGSPNEKFENDEAGKFDKTNSSPLTYEKADMNGNSHLGDEQRSNEIKLEISETVLKQPALESTVSIQNVKNETFENDLTKQESNELEESLKPCMELLTRAHDSGIDLDSEHSKSDSTEECNLSPPSNNRSKILDLLHDVKGQIDRNSLVKPSNFKGGSKTRIKQQQKQRSKSYVSVLQQPLTPEETRSVAVVLPEQSHKMPKSRQQIIASRQKFLSEQNLISDKMQEQFKQHKTSFEETAQRKPRYVRRGNSLPRSTRARNKGYDKLDFNTSSLNSSRSSVEKPEICTLHENCIFSPHKHQEILNRTLSIDNLESSLLRYGSVTSLVETDIDSGETTEYQIYTDFDNDFEFQLPLERAASMSDLATRIKHRKEAKGQLNERNVPKSKSLCTLETNIDDVFDETPSPGTLGRVPSVHELRVSKSLQKLNVPDWYKKSSVSRSGSTWSLYTSSRKDSISSSSYNFPPSITSSPCPSVSLGSNSVVIRTRITPTSARLFRSPKLQPTPEKSPTPITVQLPSEKLRQKEKPKELMPIPIVPFSKLRLMFEETSRKKQPTTQSAKPTPSPTSPTSPSAKSIESPISPITDVTVSATPTPTETKEPSTSTERPTTSRPVIPAKPILKKPTGGSTENKNVVRVEPQPTASVSLQPMQTSPRSARRVETTFNGTVGQSEVRKSKETNIDGDKPVQVVRPKVQEQTKNPQTKKSNSAENQNEHSSKSGRYSSLSKSLKSAFRRPQKSSTAESGGSKIGKTILFSKY